MNVQQILNATEHRPWPLPESSWRFYQEWNDALFLHWPVPLEVLKPYVPKPYEIEIFDNTAWVSLVIFKMAFMRLKHLPAVPGISHFDEINLRTYIKVGSRTAVYFLSIEANNFLSCMIARKVSELPYRFSKIKRTSNSCNASNNKYNDTLAITYAVKKEITQKTKIDIWLTERYALFQNTDAHSNCFEIHHKLWPLYRVACDVKQIKYSRFMPLLNGNPKAMHYSPGVKVLAWNTQRTRLDS